MIEYVVILASGSKLYQLIKWQLITFGSTLVPQPTCCWKWLFQSDGDPVYLEWTYLVFETFEHLIFQSPQFPTLHKSLLQGHGDSFLQTLMLFSKNGFESTKSNHKSLDKIASDLSMQWRIEEFGDIQVRTNSTAPFLIWERTSLFAVASQLKTTYILNRKWKE